MIEVSHLTKRYGAHVAVDDISFTVEDGCIYGLLGPNGAGKSTTMNVITGYLSPSSGAVIVDGHDIQQEPRAAKACIGYMPEIPPLYMDMSVQEYLDFVAQLKGERKRAARARRCRPRVRAHRPDRHGPPPDPQPVQGLPPARGPGRRAARRPEGHHPGRTHRRPLTPRR